VPHAHRTGRGVISDAGMNSSRRPDLAPFMLAATLATSFSASSTARPRSPVAELHDPRAHVNQPSGLGGVGDDLGVACSLGSSASRRREVVDIRRAADALEFAGRLEPAEQGDGVNEVASVSQRLDRTPHRAVRRPVEVDLLDPGEDLHGQAFGEQDRAKQRHLGLDVAG
jgi:hypothetical protein